MTLVVKPDNHSFKKSRCFRVTAFLILLGVVQFSLQSCVKQDPVYRWSGETMGTYYRVTLVTAETLQPESLRHLKQGVQEQLDNINNAMSTYLPESAVSRWNSLPRGECQQLNSDLTEVLELAFQIGEASEGYFNPLVGPLVNRWGFGPDEARALPLQAEVDALLKSADSRNLDYDPLNKTLCKAGVAPIDNPVKLDFSAIAKGYAVDKVAAYLSQQNFEGFLVDVGGELWAEGQNPDGEQWHLAIEKPEIGLTQTIHNTIVLSNAAVATSGDYRNFYERDGRRFSHTIDPHTGYPVEHALASVTVVANSVAEADAWATAILSAGPVKGREWAAEYDLAVYLIERDNSGKFSSWNSDQFGKYLK